MTNADTQTDKFTGTQFREDIAQTIVPSMAAALLDPDRAGRQIKIIVHHQDGFGGDIEITTDRCNRSAAFIHEVGGPQESDSLLTHTRISQVTKKPCLGAPG